jgi:hypothetical protein
VTGVFAISIRIGTVGRETIRIGIISCFSLSFRFGNGRPEKVF